MKISLCNEVLREMDFVSQCEFAAKLGYQGLEIAPFTLSDQPHRIEQHTRKELRQLAEDAGIQITGLHWLLVMPEGLSVTSPDSAVREKTLDVIEGLIELCADLGGEVLIHGSPKQRMIDEEENRRNVVERTKSLFASVAEAAGRAGVVYCIESLNRAETNFLNTIEECVEFVGQIANPAFRTMLDTKAALLSETESIPAILNRWLPSGMIAHIHVNDSNLRAPGQGDDRFFPIFRSLVQNEYEGVVSVEPFDYFPDGQAAAARAIGYIQGILESLRDSSRRPAEER